MDFRSLDVGTKPADARADAVHDFTPIDPLSIDVDDEGEPIKGSGKPFLNGAGKPLVLKLADPSSPRARREMVKLFIKYPHIGKPKDGWTDGLLNEATDNALGRDRETMARFVIGWNLEKDGKSIDFTPEHAAEFFEIFPDIAEVTSGHILTMRVASGNAERGSAGGPRKTDGSAESTRKPAQAGGKS